MSKTIKTTLLLVFLFSTLFINVKEAKADIPLCDGTYSPNPLVVGEPPLTNASPSKKIYFQIRSSKITDPKGTYRLIFDKGGLTTTELSIGNLTLDDHLILRRADNKDLPSIEFGSSPAVLLSPKVHSFIVIKEGSPGTACQGRYEIKPLTARSRFQELETCQLIFNPTTVSESDSLSITSGQIIAKNKNLNEQASFSDTSAGFNLSFQDKKYNLITDKNGNITSSVPLGHFLPGDYQASIEYHLTFLARGQSVSTYFNTNCAYTIPIAKGTATTKDPIQKIGVEIPPESSATKCSLAKSVYSSDEPVLINVKNAKDINSFYYTVIINPAAGTKTRLAAPEKIESTATRDLLVAPNLAPGQYKTGVYDKNHILICEEEIPFSVEQANPARPADGTDISCSISPEKPEENQKVYLQAQGLKAGVSYQVYVDYLKKVTDTQTAPEGGVQSFFLGENFPAKTHYAALLDPDGNKVCPDKDVAIVVGELSTDSGFDDFKKCGGKECLQSGGIKCDTATGRRGGTEDGILTAIGCFPTNPGGVMKAGVKIGISAGGGIALLMMVFAAFRMITSAGNPETIKKGQEQFTSAIIGLLFIIFSVLLLEIIGVDILNLPGFGR